MQQPTQDQLTLRANTAAYLQRKGASQRSKQALAMAMLACFTTSWANARHPDTDAPSVDSPALAAEPTTQAKSPVEVPLVPIESDVLNPEATREQLMQKFRDALAQPPAWIIAEHRLSDGTLEVTTRLGHFCAKPLLGHVESGLGGDITLAAPCVWF
jgi:hypothetical protein